MSERTMSRFLMVGNAHLSFTLPYPFTSRKKKKTSYRTHSSI